MSCYRNKVTGSHAIVELWDGDLDLMARFLGGTATKAADGARSTVHIGDGIAMTDPGLAVYSAEVLATIYRLQPEEAVEEAREYKEWVW